MIAVAVKIGRVTAVVICKKDSGGIAVMGIGLNGIPQLPHLFVAVPDSCVIFTDVLCHMGTVVRVSKIDEDDIRLVCLHHLEHLVEHADVAFKRGFIDRVFRSSSMDMLAGKTTTIGRM